MNKKMLLITGLLCLSGYASVSAAELNLYCKGEEQIGDTTRPYSFYGNFNLKKKIFNLKVEATTNRSKQDFPKENPWNPKMCLDPGWKFNISDTKIQVIAGCDKTDLQTTPRFGNTIWEIDRTDGSYKFLDAGRQKGKGQCVDLKKKAF